MNVPDNAVRRVSAAGVTVWDFLWKPDGTQVAFIDQEQAGRAVVVMDVVNGSTLYTEPFDLEAWQLPADLPVSEWGLAFPKGKTTGCFVAP